jgi:hypothetical protein
MYITYILDSEYREGHTFGHPEDLRDSERTLELPLQHPEIA